MAYMSQERKKALAPKIKQVLKKYGMNGTIGVDHYSTLVVNIKAGIIDFNKYTVETPADRAHRERFDLPIPVAQTAWSINPYHINSHWSGVACEFLTELREAMMIGNHDNSDIQTDYFDVGWYIDINIGRWNKPYQLVS